MVRVRAHTHAALRELSAQRGEPVAEILDRLVQAELRRVRLQEWQDSVARLKADPERWDAYRAEVRQLEGTLRDGLSEDEEIEWDESLTDSASW